MGAQLSQVGTQLLEGHLLLKVICRGDPLLQESRTMLVHSKLKQLALDIFQVKIRKEPARAPTRGGGWTRGALGPGLGR